MRRDLKEYRWRRQPPGVNTDAHVRKRGEQTGLDTLVVHAGKRCLLEARSLGSVFQS